MGESSAMFQAAGGGGGRGEEVGSRNRVTWPPSRNSARIRPTSPLSYNNRIYKTTSQNLAEGYSTAPERKHDFWDIRRPTFILSCKRPPTLEQILRSATLCTRAQTQVLYGYFCLFTIVDRRLAHPNSLNIVQWREGRGGRLS
jgi:hypothetical protein